MANDNIVWLRGHRLSAGGTTPDPEKEKAHLDKDGLIAVPRDALAKPGRKPRWHWEWEIAKTYKLPGCTVVVKVVPPSDTQRIMEWLAGLWIYDTDLDQALVLINGCYPEAVQRYILLHEMLHAIHEIIDTHIEKNMANVRTVAMELVYRMALGREERLRALLEQLGVSLESLGDYPPGIAGEP